jgi:H+-transporting ATPase
VLLAAAAASTAATLDPLDVAVLRAGAAAGIDASRGVQGEFLPIDPTRKMSEGTLTLEGRSVRGVKGTPGPVAALVGGAGGASAELMAHVDRLGATGGQVLAVAVAEPPDAPLRMAGLILFADPPRPDAAAMIAGLRAVGVGQRGRSAENQAGATGAALDCDIHAGVQPADKVSLVRGFQNIGHVVGMIGDGVNDARALRQADMGIAVASATDVARAAAGVVLTGPGLAEVVEAVRIGRTIQQRVVTFILSMISSKAMIAGFLGAVLVATAHPGLRPPLVLLLVLFNVVLTLPLAADRATPSAAPDHWSTRSVSAESLTVAALWTALLVAIYLTARRWLDFQESDLYPREAKLYTFAFLLLVLAGQAAVFNVRSRGWLWSSRPSGWVLGISALGAAAAAGLAIGGVLMVPLPVWIVLGLIPLILVCMVVVDGAKRVLLKGQVAGVS